MKRRINRNILMLALGVLARHNEGVSPSKRDEIMLRRHAGPEESELAVDQLCCSIIQREMATN